ncbi:MAG: short-subunit dehydrogenase [Myxococcota bacterium]|jgi:short-subunit dehydrogenase
MADNRPKHVVVTGASSGIGEGIARAYAAKGCAVTIVARRQERLEALALELGDNVHIAVADLSNLDTCTAWIAPAEAALGPIDVLILNAGIQYVEPALEVDDARSDTLFAVNVHAPIRQALTVAPAMVARGEGAIVIIASMSAIVHTPYMAHYSASKAAIAAYFETLRTEVEPAGVKVLTVYPGPVSTPMEAAAKEQLGNPAMADKLPTGTPAGLARKIMKALRKGKPRLIYPKAYEISRHLRVTSQWLTERFSPKIR